MSQEEKVIINIETKPAQESLKELRKTINDAKNAMLEAEEGTQEYQEALEKAAEAQHQLNEVNRIVRSSALDLGAVLQNSTRVLTGLAGGINAVRGVSALLGTDNEKLQETFVKLQAGMAIIQGLQGIDGMIKGFQNLGTIMRSTRIGMIALNAVMNANPLFLIATAAAAVAGAFVLLSRRTEEVHIAMDGATFASEEMMKVHNEHISIMQDLEIQLALVTGELTEFEAEMLRNEQEYAKAIDSIENETKEKLENVGSFWKTLGRSIVDDMSSGTIRLDNLVKEQTEILLNAQTEKEYIEEQFNTRMDIIRKREEVREKERQERLEEAERKHQERLAEQRQRSIEAEIEAQRRKYERLRQMYMTFEERMFESRLNEEQLELKRLNDDYENQLNIYRKIGEDTSELEIFFQEKRNEIRQRYAEQRLFDLFDEIEAETQARVSANQRMVDAERARLDEMDRLTQAEELLRQRQYQAALSMTMGVGSLISAVGALHADGSDRQKQLAIVGARIQSIAAAVDGYKRGMEVPIVGPVLAPIYAATALAMGQAQVNQIRSIQIPGVGGGGNGGGVPQLQQIRPPSVSDSISPVRQIATENEIELQRKPIKAFVVDSEIEAKRKTNNSIQDEADY